MPNRCKIEDLPKDDGSYMIVNNEVWLLERHPTDFSVIREVQAAQKQISELIDCDPSLSAGKAVQQLAIGMSRVSASKERRDDVMGRVREKSLAHHVYKIKGTDDEIEITDRIILTLAEDDPNKLLEIRQKYQLDLEKQYGRNSVLKVTRLSNGNPVKISNRITLHEGVESCVPEILFPMRLTAAPIAMLSLESIAAERELFSKQWYLTTGFLSPNDEVDSTASINVHEAWALVKKGGNFDASEIVIAIVDDGFDLGHDVLIKKEPKNGQDFVDGQLPLIAAKDIHGTSVASIVLANGGKMMGVAPGCAFQPLRIPLMPAVGPQYLIDVLEEANKHADVVNCSFSLGVSQFSFLEANKIFVERVKEMTENGGRRGHGLVIVFAAGNDNVPISMTEQQNLKSIKYFKYLGNGSFERNEIPANKPVHTGYPELSGIVVVAAMSSLKRKAAYSNWGEQLTVTAPSNNFIPKHPEAGPGLPGAKVVAASNRVQVADQLTDSLSEEHANYTQSFGGTSAAAAIVSGVVGLMLSVNPNLTAKEVIDILKETADDRNFDENKPVDLENHPNLQGVSARFNDKKHSLFFGAGKVDAAKAVEKAIDRLPPDEQSKFLL